ncbi:MAG: FAD-dependent oxidoreductase [Gemmatimonadaceae bacterium]
MTARPDVIVIGAGIVGAACAEAITRSGRRVLILDASFAGSGTTAAGMGHLVVMDDTPAEIALSAYSVGLWRELVPKLPRTVEYRPCGTLWVAEDEEQLDAVREKQRIYSEHGISAETLSPSQLAEAEPHLRPGLAGALHVPGDGVIYPPNGALALVQMAIANGAEIREGVRVDAIGVREVLAGDERISCDCVVNAAGAQAPALTPGLPIVPRKGHLVITERYPDFCHHQLVELGYLASAHTMTTESVAFNVQPRATGQLLIGSSRELVGWDASVNRNIVRKMLDRALDFMPDIGSAAAIRIWTGFRPATPDAVPLIGAWDESPGLWIAAGHEGLGITTSLGTGQLLADLMAGQQTAIDAAPFAPSRVLVGEAVHS